MEIRQAEESDIPRIVELLKASLGEGLMPKSEEYWRWKHIANPFGRSPVLIAVEGEQIIGVRAFMRWDWQIDGRKITAVRAVDTATHPGFQGKGIFRKLTESLLMQCEEEGVNFVFNTPNQKSKPGYIKMGWQGAGRMGIRMQPRRPFQMFWTASQSDVRKHVEIGEEPQFSHPQLPALLAEWQNWNGTNCTTAYTPEYLTWRYRDVPVAKYKTAIIEKKDRLEGFIFYRLKPSRIGLEMRITDSFTEAAKPSAAMRQVVVEHARRHKADFITIAGWPERNVFGGLAFRAPFGPIITVRKAANDSLEDFLSFRKWRPGLGDLELF